ncbi:hypothetical protein EXN66_Car011795 [Channa argus]|uniref:Uncharacterized protein n=1 Tax=Channa argus TaxID=215402 RepID=A0A6G1Q0W9_CHAAH|nr:hypothetical protein EXN66_Car011795 [Channa argus]
MQCPPKTLWKIKPLVLRPVKVSEDDTMQEHSRPNRSNSKEQLSESSTHSLSGRGYSLYGRITISNDLLYGPSARHFNYVK